MPSLSHHQSNTFTKLLLEGDSGTGKTGSLASLVGLGYKLRILDFDNGLDVLKAFVTKDHPEKLDNVEYVTLRDKRKAGPEGPTVIKPEAFMRALKLLDHWKYKNEDGSDVDLGIPAEWGPDCILVIDSLTMLSDAAFDFRVPLASKGRDGKFDLRAVYKDAQDAVEGVLALLTSESFRTNVIVMSHIKYIDQEDGSRKGLPMSVGSALSPRIPAYFNTVAQTVTKGGKRTLQTAATATIDLKNPKPFAMEKSFPIETGLADFFGVLREHPKQTTPTTTVTKLKRA